MEMLYLLHLRTIKTSGEGMRKIIEEQMQFGQINIADIKFDPKSRDEIPQLLMGLQYIYCTPEIRKQVFNELNKIVPEEKDINNGRPGMELWRILVLGTMRLSCNWDYDKLKDIADNHRTIRLMMGIGKYEDDITFHLQTIKDNVKLLTPEILDKINEIVVKSGHSLVKKKEEKIKARCDSFVVETNVHFPTDINLLFDALRKVIVLCFKLCSYLGIKGWRQKKHNMKKVKRAFNFVRKLKHSTSKNEKKKQEKDKKIKAAYKDYLYIGEGFIERAKKMLSEIICTDKRTFNLMMDIAGFIKHAERQIDQIERRVFKGEKIPHEEKVFSVFEEHTEWICKGKAGVFQELGVRVCIVEDQFRFILNYEVMYKKTDEKVTVPIIRETKDIYFDLNSCSFDKGFYSPGHRKKLEEIIDVAILPKKGKLSGKDKEIETEVNFQSERKRHPGVESAINALENHGLDRCPDHGTEGFDRYIALAVLGRNLQVLGWILQKRERQEREKRPRKAA